MRHAVCTFGQLLPSLAKLLLFGLSAHVAAADVFSAATRSKKVRTPDRTLPYPTLPYPEPCPLPVYLLVKLRVRGCHNDLRLDIVFRLLAAPGPTTSSRRCDIDLWQCWAMGNVTS